MGIYRWTGKNSQSVNVNGQCTAQGAATLKMQLRNKGITPIKVTKVNEYASFFQAKIKSQLIRHFLQQLATLIASDIPLVTSLDIIANGQTNFLMNNLLIQIKSDVANGISLATAFAQHPHYFTDLICALIAAGEESGTLESMLNRLVSYQENASKIRNNMIKIALYPATVIIIATVVTLLLLIVAVPQFENLFNNLNAPLPVLTQYMLIISKFIQHYGIIMLILLMAIVAIIKMTWQKSPQVGNFFKNISLKLPVIGSLLQKVIIVRITHTLATIVAAGIPLMKALHIASHIAGNQSYAKAMTHAESEIASGTSLHLSLSATQLFPITLIQMIAIGEESGTLDKMLFKITDWYNEQIDHAVSKLSILLEPVIMLILALLIGSIVVAMYLPIFKLEM